MEFTGKVRIETYHPVAKTSCGMYCVVVYYGWWSFSFRLGDDEVATPGLARSAEAQSHALLMLEDYDQYLSWGSIFTHHMEDAAVKLNTAPKEQFKWKGRK